MAITSNPLVGPSFLRDIVLPQFHQNNFAAETIVKNELNVKLDKDDQICRLALTPAGCPLGPLHCPLRHTAPSGQNFQPPKLPPTHPRERERLSTVCKHWLRGLCKKGDACEFLHEYNLRRMPECWWFAKHGYCSAGDECLYAHPKERKVECPDYKRGFCKLGPNCPRKHVRRVACQLYLTGLCPLGPECPRGHPKPDLPLPKAYEPPEPSSTRELGPPPPGYGRYTEYGGFGGSTSNQGNVSGFQGPPRRNMDEVMCFKCGEKGHYANHCRNRNVPGNRGGTERIRRFGEE
ncbi:RNA-binding component of cleavage and polyadenylation factor [Pleurotus ostreatus]|uniref:mRNA 3'-end-processing protein n=1 Tax=Pleurotus ostreatus TaxID=5322 RepID=A0A8H6ZYZ3_PLEOS|nr:RNA-binding component of cleavage and polyadenylation factor [Pleurotus ostreatus]KAF7436915.1 RNA-binding component of cleavage and polyadenylation factor [Pleurotus ostreatus]KAJ8702720.1 RNA-binding component of cleavage and polyadenylation factor [Pleurotus ostreatus]